MIALVSTLTIIILGALMYSSWTQASFYETLRWTFILLTLVLLGMGAVSLVPLSEYTYIRQGTRNPAIIRAGMEDIKREERSPRLGVILALVGMTLILIYLVVFV